MKKIRGIGEKMFDIEANKNDLMMILIDKYKKYTVNDHSSIPVEKVQQLMSSILYCINGYLKSIDNVIVAADEYNNAIILYERGLELEKRNLSSAKKLFKNIKLNMQDIDNIYYQDTLAEGLELFFKNYDILYAAHETPGSIDYQIALDIKDLSGIEYILEYLNRLYVENSFCSNFPSNEIENLLRGYSYDYKDIPLNIFEIVIRNMIGLAIIDENIIQLSINDSQRLELYETLSPLDIEQIQEKMIIAINEIVKFFEIDDKRQKSYMIKVAIELSHEIKHALSIKRLENVFVKANHSVIEGQESFIDGEMLELNTLRQLIDELRNCRYISDKIEMIKESVYSIRDLEDILDTCIWGDEYEKVFELLSDVEKKYIYEQIHMEVMTGIDEEDLKDWQKAFLSYGYNTPQ